MRVLESPIILERKIPDQQINNYEILIIRTTQISKFDNKNVLIIMTNFTEIERTGEDD